MEEVNERGKETKVGLNTYQLSDLENEEKKQTS